MKLHAAWLLAIALPALADENRDLERIPMGVPEPAATEAPRRDGGDLTARIYVEGLIAASTLRGALLVPAPAPEPPRREERVFLDARVEWHPAEDIALTYSGRLNARDQPGMGFPRRDNAANDLREAYASWRPAEHTFLDAGRINLKSGVAIGYNPTDFFKARAVVEPVTLDPRALREDRLGTVMLRAQLLGHAGSITAAYAPDLHQPGSLAASADRGFSPMLGRTNSTDRFLLPATVDAGGELNPEFLYFRESGRSRIGANIAGVAGKSVVPYAEWAGGRRAGLLDEAIAFGRLAGLLPADAPVVLTQGSGERFRNEVSIGASYATESKVTVNLEYHYNEGALSAEDWKRWFRIGQGRDASSAIVRQLWLVRGYASDRQVPLARHSLFLRFDAVDAFVSKLEITGFVNADVRDGSALFQLGADYALSDRCTIGILATASSGGRRSDLGSLPQARSALIKAAWYF